MCCLRFIRLECVHRGGFATHRQLHYSLFKTGKQNAVCYDGYWISSGNASTLTNSGTNADCDASISICISNHDFYIVQWLQSHPELLTTNASVQWALCADRSCLCDWFLHLLQFHTTSPLSWSETHLFPWVKEKGADNVICDTDRHFNFYQGQKRTIFMGCSHRTPANLVTPVNILSHISGRARHCSVNLTLGLCKSKYSSFSVGRTAARVS